METTLRRIGETIGETIGALSSAWADGAWRPDGWPPTLWLLLGALFVLLVLLGLRRGRPRPLEVRPPQLLITQGEIIPDMASDGVAPRRRRGIDPSGSAAGSLTMTVSNLSRYPVQVLEVALREETRGAPRVAEVEAVVPAMGSVEVAVRVPLSIRGDGWIDLYCYAAAPRHKVHRHRAELVWEPWASRFKVAPMEQVATPARRLASEERQARFELADPDLAGVAEYAVVPAAPPPAAAPLPADRPARGSERAVSRAAGGDRPTAVSRVAAVPGPEPEAAEGDAAASKAAAATPSLGALWDRLPDGDRAARSSELDAGGGDVGALVPVRPPPGAPGGMSEKPARVASSSISPSVRAPDAGADEPAAPPASDAGAGPARSTPRPPRSPAAREPAVDRAADARHDPGGTGSTSGAVRDRPIASGNGREDRPASGARAPATPMPPATGSAARPAPAPRAAPESLPREPSPSTAAPRVAPRDAPSAAPAEPRAAAGRGTRAGPRPAVAPAPEEGSRRSDPAAGREGAVAPARPTPTGAGQPPRPSRADAASRADGKPTPRTVDLPRGDDEPAERTAPRPGRPAAPRPDAAPAAPPSDVPAVPPRDEPDVPAVPPLPAPAAAPPPRAASPAPRRRPRLEFPDEF